MFDIMLGLLARAKPPISSVIDCRTVTHRDLSLMEIRFVQGNSYFAARAYSTGTWIAKTPLGPELNEDGTLKMGNINDVAKVDVYVSSLDLSRRRWPDTEGLVQVQEALDKASFDVIKNAYPSLGDLLYKTVFTFTPIPTIQVCLASGKRFKTLLGTIAVDVRGNIQVTSKAVPEVEQLAKSMRMSGRLSLPEVLRYE